MGKNLRLSLKNPNFARFTILSHFKLVEDVLITRKKTRSF